MAGDFEDFLGGATSGAGAGSAGGPWGALAGGLIGGLSGGLFGGKKSAPNFNDLIQQRQAQIDQFAQKLEASRNSILANYQNLQSNTMKRFSGDFEANLAGRGISPAGGAFASGVGREATMLQGQYDAQNAEMTNQNLNTIGGMQANLFNTQLDANMNTSMLNYQNQLSRQGALGNILTTGIGMLGRSGIFGQGNPNTSGGRSVFGSGGQQGNLNLSTNPVMGGYGGYLGGGANALQSAYSGGDSGFENFMKMLRGSN